MMLENEQAEKVLVFLAEKSHVMEIKEWKDLEPWSWMFQSERRDWQLEK